MMETNLVLEALKFMVIGMGIVFLFLTVMIFVLKLQEKLIAKYFPEKPKEELSQWKPQIVSNNDEKDTIAAISAAIIHYNNQKGK